MPLELPLGPSPSSAVAPPKTIRRCPPPSAGTHVKVCPQRGPGSSLLGSMWNSAQRNPVVEDDILAPLRPNRLPHAMPVRANASASWVWPPTPEGAVGSVASQPGRSNVKKIAGLGAHQRESTFGPFHVSSFQPLTRVRFASSESTEPPQGSDDRRASVGRVCRHGGGRHRRPALRGAAEQV